MKRTVEHVITGLEIGGAELMLAHLARGGTRFEHSVTSLSSTGRIGDDLVADGVRVQELDMKKNFGAFLRIRRLAARLKQQDPQLVQTWLYHADLVGGLAARRAGLPVVWNLRQTDVAPNTHKINTAIVVRLCALLSRSIPVRIVCGSKSAAEAHRKMGFNGEKMVIISNGVDVHAFKPDDEARLGVRGELGLADDVPLIARVARYHAQKDYRGFVEMARIIAVERPDAHFMAVGKEVDWSNSELAGWIKEAGLGQHFHLLGARRDIARLMSATDVFVSSSLYGEGFPNVIAEAMACEVPSVATDVGDSAEIIGNGKYIVPPGSYEALARAALNLLNRHQGERRRAGQQARRRVAEQFALEAMICRYEKLYGEILGTSDDTFPRSAAT